MRLIRRSLPRRAALAGSTDADIEAMVWRLNTTPHKYLGFRTPLEAFTDSPGVAPQV